MKTLMTLSFLLLGINLAYSSSCGSVTCYDDCSHSYQQVAGSNCESGGVWNSEQNCYQARGYCQDSNSNCFQKTYCYDSCTKQYVWSTGNKCKSVYDSNNSCWTEIGWCVDE